MKVFDGDALGESLMKLSADCLKCGSSITFEKGAKLAGEYGIAENVVLCGECKSVFEVNLAPSCMTLTNDVTDRYPFLVGEVRENAGVRISGETNKGTGRKKWPFTLLAVLVLIVAGVVARQFFWGSVSGPERALPLVDAKRQVLVKMENPQIFKSKMQTAIRLLAGAPNLSSLPLPDLVPGLSGDGEKYAEGLVGLMDVAEQAAFLIVGNEDEGPGTGFYLSFFPHEKAFDELMANPDSALISIEKWEQDKGGEGWVLKPAIPVAGFFEKLPALYLLRSGTAKNSPVLVTDRPESIYEMKKALAGSASRIRIKRYNPAPDYLQARYPVKTPSGEAESATTEIAWIEDETSAHAQFYSDAFSLITGRSVPKSGLKGNDLPLLGNGSLALVGAVDIPYACFTAFPSAGDPIGRVMKELGPLVPSQYREDIRKIMAEGRISVVMVTEDESKTDPNTAYFVLESTAKESLERLATLPKSMMKKSALEGWDSCYTVEIGRNFNLLLAQRGNVLLLGMGALSEYGRKAGIPTEIRDFAAPHDLANLVATPSFWNIVRPTFKQRMMAYGIDPSFMDDPAIKPCTVQLRVMTPEKADLGLYWGSTKK